MQFKHYPMYQGKRENVLLPSIKYSRFTQMKQMKKYPSNLSTNYQIRNCFLIDIDFSMMSIIKLNSKICAKIWNY
ncbi:hypothetical protein FGO68_gene5844 [Halteria grandinella]|uniref:Uncharacterized protein n=1 Tax=Halteria grandinella TaxID=5974 RepID=A0A8J8NWJ3_HALGN|nr:hypothetical protein FGO68_gene5844 [Halteria grandinella]